MAIAPDREVILEAGSYDLCKAADYGTQQSGGYYTWEPRGNGYELVITGVQGLTIRGSGKDATELVTDSPNANVLALQDCTRVVLEGVSARHAGEKNGGGIYLENSTDMVMQEIGISGGTVGMKMNACADISLVDSEISRCVFYGVVAEDTDGLCVEGCTLRDMGDIENDGGIVFRLCDSKNAQISGCHISDNTLAHLIDCHPCKNVKLTDNSFTGNRVQDAALDVDDGMVFDSNVMEQNDIRSWFPATWSTVQDTIGKHWDGKMLEQYYGQDQPKWAQTQVRVKTVDEFLAAIGPDREIILESGIYDLSTAKEYGSGHTAFYYWEEAFDGPGLVITDVPNMTIRSESGDGKDCTISAVPRYANVLSFQRCGDIMLSGFTAGHTAEPGECSGGVLDFEDCSSVLVENCGLYGCGVMGITAHLGENLTAQNCEIYECSQGGIWLVEVNGVAINGCTFRKLGGKEITLRNCTEATVDGKDVSEDESISRRK